MKKLLKAFTLAEILITLGIVGIVAKLTLPALTQNVQQQIAETGLAKAINTLESVNAKMQLESGSKKINASYGHQGDQGIFTKYYLEALPTYLNGSYKMKKYTINGSSSNYPVFITKDGIVFTSDNPNSYTIRQATSPKYYSSCDSFITIDTNGAKGPNKYGKDQFRVVIDNYGAVIPYGGMQYAEYSGNNNVLWENGCPSNKSIKPTNPRACTGAIVDNGYKILYGYNAL
ncbi:MAG: type II secretion system GspH family protein [Candidatus Gastranaerophilales bacterium]|nr:type II secretion system GspH family protein [Candidatus Gastranaerophilales bacterium]MCM1072807.1 type II secretion system GspH family protein [Bacteroides sp.]